MKHLITLCISLLLALQASADGGSPKRPRPARAVRLNVSTFGGEGGVGANVSTILNLQIWRALRIPALSGRETSGEVVGSGTLPHLDPDSAVTEALNTHSHMILWGKAFRYADETIVQAYLDIPRSSGESFQKWTIVVLARPDVYGEFEVELPARRYEFEPIVLANKIVDRYQKIDSLEIHDLVTGDVKGVIGQCVFGVRSDEGNRIVISYRHGDRDDTGYIRIPNLDSVQNEAIDFTGAMIRVLRRDWPGAELMLQSVTLRPETPTAIRIDAHLLRAMSLAKMRRPWGDDGAEAELLNPYLATTVRYLVMLRVQDVSQAVDREGETEVNEAIENLAAFVSKKRSFFDEGDSLIVAVDKFVQAWRESNRATARP